MQLNIHNSNMHHPVHVYQRASATCPKKLKAFSHITLIALLETALPQTLKTPPVDLHTPVLGNNNQSVKARLTN